MTLYNPPSLSGIPTGSGTATQVAFWSTSTNISSDSNLFWDNTNKRLGIDTATPISKIDLTNLNLGAFNNAVANDAFGLSLNNTTASTASVFQYSPMISWQGSLWTGSVSQPARFRNYLLPASGGGAFLIWEGSINNSSYSTKALLRLSDGLFFAPTLQTSLLEIGETSFFPSGDDTFNIQFPNTSDGYVNFIFPFVGATWNYSPNGSISYTSDLFAPAFSVDNGGNMFIAGALFVQNSTVLDDGAITTSGGGQLTVGALQIASGLIIDNVNATAVDIVNRYLYASDGSSVTLQWQNCILSDQNQFGSINWNQRHGLGTDGSTTLFDWNSTTEFKVNVGLNAAGYLKDSTGSVGASGNILTSTVTGTAWKAPVAAGSPFVAAHADLTAQGAAVSSVTTVTAPNDGSSHTYQVGGYVTITAISAGSLTLQATYTDETSTSRTQSFFGEGLTTAALSTTGGFAFPPMTIRAKQNTAITVLTTFTGVSTTYDVGGVIIQLT